MAPLTPLPKPLPNNLVDIENLIKERFALIDSIDEEMEAKRIERDNIKRDIIALQTAGKELLMIPPRPKKDATVREEQPKQ